MTALLANPVQATGLVLVSAALLVMLMHRLVSGLNSGRHAWQRRLRERLGVAAGRPIGPIGGVRPLRAAARPAEVETGQFTDGFVDLALPVHGERG